MRLAYEASDECQTALSTLYSNLSSLIKIDHSNNYFKVNQLYSPKYSKWPQ